MECVECVCEGQTPCVMVVKVFIPLQVQRPKVIVKLVF